MRVDFAKNSNRFPPIEMNGKQLKVVDEGQAKLLGFTTTSNLNSKSQVNNIALNSSKRIYLLVQFKGAKVTIQDNLQFHSVCVHPILEYVSIVFHYIPYENT